MTSAPLRPLSLREELRKQLALAWPVSLASLGLMLMNAVDVAVVGRLGATSLAALAAGSLWSYAITVPFQFCLGALDPMIAQAVGAGDPRAAGRALRRGLSLAALLSLPAMALHGLAEPGLALLGQPAAALAPAATFCRAVALSLPATLAFAVLRSFLQAHGVVRPAAIVIVAANALNLALNLALVYGFGPVPALGVLGSGVATAICRYALVLGLAALTAPLLRAAWREGVEDAPIRPIFRLLWLGAPTGLQVGLEVWAFQSVAIMMGWLGERALAANSVLLSLSSLSFMMPLGVSAAISARVGNLIGAGAPWGRAAWTAVGIGASTMLGSAALYVAAPEALLAIYTDDASVLSLALTVMPVVAAFQVFDGVQIVSVGALRGAGDLRFPVLLTVFGYWLFGLPLAWHLGFRLELGAVGVWAGLAIGLGTMSGLLVLRLRHTVSRGGFRVSVEQGAPPV